MKKELIYYIVIEPSNKSDFEPVILDYGVDYDKASKIMRDYINENGMKYKKKPSHLFIKQTAYGLPANYHVITPHLEKEESVV